MEMKTVTPDAISSIVANPSPDSPADLPDLVVQVLDLKAVGNRFMCTASDGNQKLKGILQSSHSAMISSGAIQNLGLIRILDYTLNDIPEKSDKYLLVTKCEAVSPALEMKIKIIENAFFKQDWRSMGKMQILEYICMKWVLCLLIGLIVSLVGLLINLAVENVTCQKFIVTSNMMLEKRYWTAFFVFAASNFALTPLISPAAAGSGIPEVKAYLNDVDLPNIFSPRTLIGKIIGIISAVSSSLMIGKAGPMVHIASSVAALLSQGGTEKHHLNWKWLEVFKNDRDRRDLVACGTAAGIAATFRAPVGGVLFAFEEMASWWRGALLWRAFFSTAVVAIMLRSFMDICYSGKCGLFGTGGLIMFNVTSENVVFHLNDVPAVLLLGVIGGILGSLFNSILKRVLRIYNLSNKLRTLLRGQRKLTLMQNIIAGRVAFGQEKLFRMCNLPCNIF